MEDPAIMIKQWTDREAVQSTYSFDEFLLSHKGEQTAQTWIRAYRRSITVRIRVGLDVTFFFKNIIVKRSENERTQ